MNKEALYTKTTDVFAAECGVKPGTVRVRLSRTGSYFGVRPRKLPSGRLIWPDNGQDQLLALTEHHSQNHTQA